MAKSFRLGTRGSKLAMVQAKSTALRLEALHPGLRVELVVISTQGDRSTEMPLSAGEGMGLFTKEIQNLLLKDHVDGAVHSLKDLPTQTVNGLVMAGVSERADWRDAWLCPSGHSLIELPAGSKVGTGSPRRQAQIKRIRPDLQCVEFRGNVDTRLAKLDQGVVAAAVLAAAGLSRLGLSGRVSSFFDEYQMLPAPGQGFLAYECREKDASSVALLKSLDHPHARACSDAERAFLERLGAGCHAPVGALGRSAGHRLHLMGFTQNKDGRVFSAEAEGTDGAAIALGKSLAEKLLAEGAEMTR
ncbi:MAG: hydroxymethylbilane synthase [candidate division FCPU426 bacterium]